MIQVKDIPKEIIKFPGLLIKKNHVFALGKEVVLAEDADYDWSFSTENRNFDQNSFRKLLSKYDLHSCQLQLFKGWDDALSSTDFRITYDYDVEIYNAINSNKVMIEEDNSVSEWGFESLYRKRKHFSDPVSFDIINGKITNEKYVYARYITYVKEESYYNEDAWIAGFLTGLRGNKIKAIIKRENIKKLF